MRRTLSIKIIICLVLLFNELSREICKAQDLLGLGFMQKKVEIPVIMGKYKHILDPPGQTLTNAPKGSWYINDHCFFVEKNGKIHWFGINNPYVAKGEDPYGPGSHRYIGHAVADEPFGPWTACEPALQLDANDKSGNIGACFVIEKDGKYLMYYNHSGSTYIAESFDLYKWQPIKTVGKIALNGENQRDPCIIHYNKDLLLYAAGGYDNIAAILLSKSNDGLQWKSDKPVLRAFNLKESWGMLESPFVLKHQGIYYLFVNNSHHQYQETLVFVSDNPFAFDWNKPLCTLFSHAAEIFEWNDKTYISHCGIEDEHWRWHDTGEPSGLYLAELNWINPK